MRIKVEIELRRPSRHAAALLLGVVSLAVPGAVLAGHQFPDVPTGHTFHSQISAIAEAGITAGFSDGGYHPSEPVTRQAMAAFMHRGFGRAGMAIGDPPMSLSVNVPAGSYSGVFVPVRQLTITVPGASNALNPTQLVHLQGRVDFVTTMNAPQGCPCEFWAQIRDMTTNATSLPQMQTFESAATEGFHYNFDAEALFAAPPSTRTYQLEVRLNLRDEVPSAAVFDLSDLSSLSAMTFPFGPAGTSDVSTVSASNVAPPDNHLLERRRH